MPDFPKPTAAHQWLEQFAGDWTTEAEIHMIPGQPPMRSTGKEHIRMLGGFWLISEGQSACDKMPYGNILSLGYDPVKNKYIGSWVDTMTSKLWTYEGTLNAEGSVLTLETEGSCPMEPDKHRQFREVLERVTPDHKRFSSSLQLDDGTWNTCVIVNARRAV